MEEKEKKEIDVRLYTSVVLIIIFILVVIYMVMFSVNRYFSKNKTEIINEKDNIIKNENKTEETDGFKNIKRKS